MQPILASFCMTCMKLCHKQFQFKMEVMPIIIITIWYKWPRMYAWCFNWMLSSIINYSTYLWCGCFSIHRFSLVFKCSLYRVYVAASTIPIPVRIVTQSPSQSRGFPFLFVIRSYYSSWLPSIFNASLFTFQLKLNIIKNKIRSWKSIVFCILVFPL